MKNDMQGKVLIIGSDLEAKVDIAEFLPEEEKHNSANMLCQLEITPYVRKEWTVRYYDKNEKKERIPLEEFLEKEFRLRTSEVCPVCGEVNKRKLRYLFSMGRGIPYNLYFCSYKCLHQFMTHIGDYQSLMAELSPTTDIIW